MNNLIFNFSLVTAICLHASIATAQTANPLSEAARIQKQATSQEQSRLNIEELKAQTKKSLNNILQSLFYRYYGEVKKSGLKLANAQKVADDLSAQRRRIGGCCDILIATKVDGGMYVTTTEGDGLFAIDGYGLQSVRGVIQDEQYERTGTLSNQCNYEVNISYKNSRTYSCSEFLSRKIDNKVVTDMMEMLPIAMKNYIR